MGFSWGFQGARRIIYSQLPFIIFLMVFLTAAAPMADARIYVDITSPERVVPIAISPLVGPEGAELAGVIVDDLEFTGFFVSLDPKGFGEAPHVAFQRENWLPTGVLFVMKGKTTVYDGEMEASATLYDVQTGGAIFARRYKAPKTALRAIAHSIADDIYRELTGLQSAFKNRLSFLMETSGVKDVYLADWDGARAKPVGLKENMLFPARWSRDGNWLLYSASRKKNWALYLLELRTLKEKRIFDKPGTNIAGDMNAAGDVVFSSSFEGTSNIYLLKADGALTRLTKSSSIDVSPAFSPDASRIAYVSDRGGSPQIYIMDAKGYNTSRLSFGGGYNTSPAWSPDGERVVFSGRYQGQNQIFVAGTDGSELYMLTTKGNNEDPCFSSDGRFIAFSSDRGGRKAVYIMRANGEAQKRITPPGVNAYGPKWYY